MLCGVVSFFVVFLVEIVCFSSSSCVCCVASKTSHLVAPSSWIEKFGSD